MEDLQRYNFLLAEMRMLDDKYRNISNIPGSPSLSDIMLILKDKFNVSEAQYLYDEFKQLNIDICSSPERYETFMTLAR